MTYRTLCRRQRSQAVITSNEESPIYVATLLLDVRRVAILEGHVVTRHVQDAATRSVTLTSRVFALPVLYGCMHTERLTFCAV